ncbi:hypothetical protein ACF0HZ_07435 [Leuconostoc suionicum]
MDKISISTMLKELIFKLNNSIKKHKIRSTVIALILSSIGVALSILRDYIYSKHPSIKPNLPVSTISQNHVNIVWYIGSDILISLLVLLPILHLMILCAFELLFNKDSDDLTIKYCREIYLVFFYYSLFGTLFFTLVKYSWKYVSIVVTLTTLLIIPIFSFVLRIAYNHLIYKPDNMRIRKSQKPMRK